MVIFKPGIIVLVGTVGAGKTTQMDIIFSKLRKNGFTVQKTVLKRGHLFTNILEETLARILLVRKDNDCAIRAIVEKRPIVFKKLFNLFVLSDIVSIFTNFVFSIYLPKKLGRIVIVEEFIPGAIADYIHMSEFVGFKTHGLYIFSCFLTKLSYLCKPVYTVFLDSPNRLLQPRWKKRKSPTQRDDYLEMQRSLLLKISKNLSERFLYLDTSCHSISHTNNIIINFINSD